MKAVLAGTVIAEADDADLISIEGNWYFPLTSVAPGVLVESPTPYTCPWKGEAQYYSAVVDGEQYKDAAWGYPRPYPSAQERVGKDISGHIAFAPSVEVGP
ncbi:uncharacterized protein (DUF427 family) [Microbacterium ginsengiterrae]|uniref:Uncharacterized protein (DUF427 family) n=1 Tax=Microbacterium ginsengiterrae TaxID=546115 RepID=A0A7W9CC02_9MICO|nr:DUF427 domain-containing protein [Microbacterium ginsengiterrae]MBB5742804.1 uncharacterized protein (DUF427 family) [Microbacterium ginsengiterrae]